MKVTVRIVKTDDWEAIYLNNNKVEESHHISIENICEYLQCLIKDNAEPISNIEGEHYYLNIEYAENNGFPMHFSDIPKNMLE